MERRIYAFDFDGCIGDTLRIWYMSCVAQLNQRKIELDNRIIMHNILPDLDQAKNHGVDDIGQFVRSVVMNVIKQSSVYELHSGLSEALKAIRENGHWTAIISSSDRNVIEDVLTRHGLKLMFDLILGRDDVDGRRKPDSWPLQKAAQILGIDTANMVMIGDSSVDIIAAHAAGATPILFHTQKHGEFYQLDDLLKLKPHHVISDFLELIKLLSL